MATMCENDRIVLHRHLRRARRARQVYAASPWPSSKQVTLNSISVVPQKVEGPDTSFRNGPRTNTIIRTSDVQYALGQVPVI